MNLEQHIRKAAEKCIHAANVCEEVGDPIMDDTFDEILRELVMDVLADEVTENSKTGLPLLRKKK